MGVRCQFGKGSLMLGLIAEDIVPVIGEGDGIFHQIPVVGYILGIGEEGTVLFQFLLHTVLVHFTAVYIGHGAYQIFAAVCLCD